MSSPGLRSHQQWVAPAVPWGWMAWKSPSVPTALSFAASISCKATPAFFLRGSFLLPCLWGSRSLQPISEGIS